MVDRTTYIGGGDAAAIAGVGRWGSAYSVWAMKTGLTVEDPAAVTERMQWGLVLERPVAEEWARRNGVVELRRGSFRRHRIPYIGGHPDFFGTHPVDGLSGIEVKLSDRPSEWEGDEIPVQYYLQVQHYQLLTGLPVWYLAVLLRGNELRSFRIERDEEIIDGLLETYADFWQLVQSKTPPEVDGHEATADALKRRYPRGDDSEMVADIPAQGMIDDLLAVRRELRDAEIREASVVNRIKERMGSVSRLIGPGATISWKNNKDSIKTDWQSVAAAYRRILSELDTPPDFDTIESIHTNTIPGARVFRVTSTEEKG